MAIPTGYQVISCTAYNNRDANLNGGATGQNVIGWPYHDTGNGTWTFDKQGTSGNEYKISTIAVSSGNATVYATSSDPSSGDEIYCTPSATVYNVVPLSDDEENYKISVTASNGTVFYWTLNNDTEGTAVTLEEDNGTSTQIWSITEPSS